MRHGLLDSTLLALLLAAPAFAQTPAPAPPVPKTDGKTPVPSADAKAKPAKATAKPAPDSNAAVKPEVAMGSKARSLALKKAKKARTPYKGPMVDINSASREELKKLPGVTDVAADKIIAGRPYLTKAHLVTHEVVSYGLYETIKGRIIAKQKNVK